MAAKKVDLSINYTPIQIEGFVQQLIGAAVTGTLSTLKGYKEKQDIKLSIDGDSVDITIDNDEIQANPFVNSFIRNTVIGMVSSLKDVGQIERVEISINS